MFTSPDTEKHKGKGLTLTGGAKEQGQLITDAWSSKDTRVTSKAITWKIKI